MLRCSKPLEEDTFDKIALFCNIPKENVIENPTIDLLYEVPLLLEKQHFADIVLKQFKMKSSAPDLSDWKKMVHKAKHPKHEVMIGIVGKYVKLHDAYLSIVEALKHAGYICSSKVDIRWIDSETVTKRNVDKTLSGCDGIIVPGGFVNLVI